MNNGDPTFNRILFDLSAQCRMQTELMIDCSSHNSKALGTYDNKQDHHSIMVSTVIFFCYVGRIRAR